MTDTDGDEAVKDLVRSHWHGRAATFDPESQHGIHSDEQRERWLAVLRGWVGDSHRVLDVGCGTGVVSALLASLGNEVVGVDFAPGMLRRAREKARRSDGGLAFCRGDAERLPVPDDAFGALTARHLVWTLPNPDAALREWRRVIEPGGRVVLFEGHWEHDEPWAEYEEIHDDLPIYDGRPSETLCERLSDAGFRDVEHGPLTDAALWGREPRHDYYAVRGTVPR